MARISDNQKNVMADFFIQNTKLIENKFSDSFTFENGERLWAELAELLNASGKAQKDVKKWKKTWDDLKRTIKDKAAAVKRESLKTGNEQINLMLSPLESKIAGIIGEVLINGDPVVKEIGINKSEVNIDFNTVCPDQIQSMSSNVNQKNISIDAELTGGEEVTMKNKNMPKRKVSPLQTDSFGSATYGEMIKQQKTLADATINQAIQLKRIALAMEERNLIERERNTILELKYSKKYKQTQSSSNVEYEDEDVTVIYANDI